jgi:hypothetical protein
MIRQNCGKDTRTEFQNSPKISPYLLSKCKLVPSVVVASHRANFPVTSSPLFGMCKIQLFRYVARNIWTMNKIPYNVCVI